MQRRHNCSPAASFANCVMTLYLLKVHLQTFLSIPITPKCQILTCDTLVANERYELNIRTGGAGNHHCDVKCAYCDDFYLTSTVFLRFARFSRFLVRGVTTQGDYRNSSLLFCAKSYRDMCYFTERDQPRGSVVTAPDY